MSQPDNIPITFPSLKELLDDIFNTWPPIKLSYNVAKSIKEADPEERYTHVILYENIKEESGDLAKSDVWPIKEWRDSYESYLRRQAKSEEDRKRRFQESQCAEDLAAFIEKEMGLDNSEALALAERYVRIRNLKILKIYEIRLEDYGLE